MNKPENKRKAKWGNEKRNSDISSNSSASNSRTKLNLPCNNCKQVFHEYHEFSLHYAERHAKLGPPPDQETMTHLSIEKLITKHLEENNELPKEQINSNEKDEQNVKPDEQDEKQKIDVIEIDSDSSLSDKVAHISSDKQTKLNKQKLQANNVEEYRKLKEKMKLLKKINRRRKQHIKDSETDSSDTDSEGETTAPIKKKGRVRNENNKLKRKSKKRKHDNGETSSNDSTDSDNEFKEAYRRFTKNKLKEIKLKKTSKRSHYSDSLSSEETSSSDDESTIHKSSLKCTSKKETRKSSMEDNVLREKGVEERLSTDVRLSTDKESNKTSSKDDVNIKQHEIKDKKHNSKANILKRNSGKREVSSSASSSDDDKEVNKTSHRDSINNSLKKKHCTYRADRKIPKKEINKYTNNSDDEDSSTSDSNVDTKVIKQSHKAKNSKKTGKDKVRRKLEKIKKHNSRESMSSSDSSGTTESETSDISHRNKHKNKHKRKSKHVDNTTSSDSDTTNNSSDADTDELLSLMGQVFTGKSKLKRLLELFILTSNKRSKTRKSKKKLRKYLNRKIRRKKLIRCRICRLKLRKSNLKKHLKMHTKKRKDRRESKSEETIKNTEVTADTRKLDAKNPNTSKEINNTSNTNQPTLSTPDTEKTLPNTSNIDVVELTPSETNTPTKFKPIIYKCAVCKGHFFNKKSQQKHIDLKKHSELKNRHQCKTCKLIFCDVWSLSRHVQLHHRRFNLMSQEDFQIVTDGSVEQNPPVAERKQTKKCRRESKSEETIRTTEVTADTRKVDAKNSNTNKEINNTSNTNQPTLSTPDTEKTLSNTSNIDVAELTPSGANQSIQNTPSVDDKTEHNPPKVHDRNPETFLKQEEPQKPNPTKFKPVIYKCAVCKGHFFNKKSQQKHINLKKHSELKNRHQCKTCKLNFCDVWSLSRHVQLHHRRFNLMSQEDFQIVTDGSVEQNPPVAERKQTENIGPSNFDSSRQNRAEDIEAEQNKISTSKPQKQTQTLPNNSENTVKTLYKCGHCGFHFLASKALTSHLYRRCKTDKTRKFLQTKCSFCGLKFSGISLLRHQNIHHKKFNLNQEDFVIETKCSKTLGNKPLLEGNIAKSLNDPAKDAKLSATVTKRLNLGKDKSCLDSKKSGWVNIIYKCKVCDLHFLTDCSFKAHRRNCSQMRNTDKPEAKCLKCGLNFFLPSALTKHDLLHHKKLGLGREKIFSAIKVKGYRKVCKKMAQSNTKTTHQEENDSHDRNDEENRKTLDATSTSNSTEAQRLDKVKLTCRDNSWSISGNTSVKDIISPKKSIDKPDSTFSIKECSIKLEKFGSVPNAYAGNTGHISRVIVADNNNKVSPSKNLNKVHAKNTTKADISKSKSNMRDLNENSSTAEKHFYQLSNVKTNRDKTKKSLENTAENSKAEDFMETNDDDDIIQIIDYIKFEDDNELCPNTSNPIDGMENAMVISLGNLNASEDFVVKSDIKDEVYSIDSDDSGTAFVLQYDPDIEK